jgi:predicted secreted protein
VQLGSALAIYALFWTLSFFLTLPFGVRTHEEAGIESTPGQADSAPHGFRLGRAVLRATLLSGACFGLFYLNYVYGWIGAGQLDWTKPPQP